jgi:hypothetical protein
MLGRSAAQMLLPSDQPPGVGRADAMNKLRPSADSIGHPSATDEFTSLTRAAGPNDPGQFGTQEKPCA